MISTKGTKRRNEKIGYLFVLPASFFIILFYIIGVGISFYISLYRYNILSPKNTFIGFSNYQRALWNDPIFWIALKNTFYFMGVSVPAILITSFCFAFFTDKLLRRGRSIIQTIYFIPTVTPMVVLSLIWVWIYQENGMINIILGKLHLPTPNWLMDQNTAMLAIIILTVWQAFGYFMLIFIAGLSEIPSVFYDAAKIDGANLFQTMWHVTIPLLKNVFVFVIIMLLIGCSQMFTQVYVMTGGGPAYATEVMVSYIYKQSFRYYHMGYGAAMSWLLFAFILVAIVLQLRALKARQIY